MTVKSKLLNTEFEAITTAKANTAKPHERLERAQRAASQADLQVELAVRAYNKARIQLIVDHITEAGQNWCQTGRHLVDGPVKVRTSSGTRWAGSHYTEHLEDYNESYSVCSECSGQGRSGWSHGSTSGTSRVINVDGQQLWIDEFQRYLPYQLKDLIKLWDIPPEIQFGPGRSPRYSIGGKDIFATGEEAK